MKNIYENRFYKNLSTTGQNQFEDVELQRVLGASAQIFLISEMVKDLCFEAQNKYRNAEELLFDIQDLTNHFKNTRGKASQAISNAIDLMYGDPVNQTGNNLQNLTEYFANNIDNFLKKNEVNLQKVSQYGQALLSGMKTIMLFDYSSTVAKMLERYHEELKIIIPESRALDGGKPYLNYLGKSNFQLHYIPDAAIYYYLKDCDAVFIGSETFYPDGRVFNTVGSDMLAYMCDELKVPFYVLTTMLKIDTRSRYGYKKPDVIVDLKNIFSTINKNKDLDHIDFTCPELVEISSTFITSYITEYGIVSPSSIYYLMIESQKTWGEFNDE